MLKGQVRPTAANKRKPVWRSRQFLLTWAQCGEKMEIVRDELRGRFGDEAIIKFTETRRVGERAFDLTRDANVYHANIRSVRGNGIGALEYVRKGGAWCDWGVMPEAVRGMERGEKMKFLLEHTPEEIASCGMFTVFEVNAALRMKEALQRERITWPIFRKRTVEWYHGATGSGKTRVAMRKVTQYASWTKLNGSMKTFINGYRGEQAVVIDDLRAGSVDFEMLLAMLDGYPCIVNVKGGYVEWRAELIILTAPKRPEEIFYDHTREQPWDKVDQLIRRIDLLRDFDVVRYGDDPADLDTVVMPVYGPEPMPTPEIAPEEAELIEEEEFSVIPGSLDCDVQIVDGVVHPLFGPMPKFK